MTSQIKGSEEDFKQWFEDAKKNAISDFGYSEMETLNFSEKVWRQYYDYGLTPFESVLQHLKKIFQHQNG